MSCIDPFLGVVAELRASMKRRSFEQPTPVQKAVLAVDAREANLRISSQTGSGKTVALGIALSQDLIDHADDATPRALIVAPTRELAAQLRRELTWLFEDTAIRSTVVTGGSDWRREERALREGPHIVVGTPGRLLDHLRGGRLNLSAVRHVVLDEADQMLDMGFRDELEAIVEALPAERRSHLVSATFPGYVRRFADAFQGQDVVAVDGGSSKQHQDIEHLAYLLQPTERYDALINELLMAEGERCLVFVRRRIDATEVAERLVNEGIAAQALSGDLAQAQRNRCLSAFRNGQVQVLVATDVAARGIDVADIRAVVHLDAPGDPANYTHRAGRTGRAGQKGRSLLLVPFRAERQLRRMLQTAGVKARFVSPPTEEKVRSALRDSGRRRLKSQLEEAAAPAEHHTAHAAELLKEMDPEVLVAQLLAFAGPQPPTEPRSLRSASRPPMEARRPARRDHRDGPQGDDFVPFYVSWGRMRGATAKRVLALMCRRGDIRGKDVGKIDIKPHGTVVEVSRPVASHFRENAAAPDPREPKILIEPFRPRRGGPHRGGPQSGGPQSGGPKAGGPKGGPKRGAPHRGGPKLGGSKLGGPKPRAFSPRGR